MTVALRAALAAALAAAAVAATGGRALATPSFARQTELGCAACHQPAWPELSELGWAFKERGYQLPLGADDPVRQARSIRPGGPGERLELLRQVPLALRAQSAVAVPVDPSETGRSPVELQMLSDLFLLAGAPVYRNLSFSASASIAPEPFLHHASLGLHDLLGERVLSVRAGRILLLDFLRPNHRRLTREPSPVGASQVGLEPTRLDSTQLGLDAYGRPIEPLFWRVAVVQGSQAEDGVSDADAYKDLFGELQLTLPGGHALGALGYSGRSQITDQARGVEVRFTDRFWIAGAHAELRRGPLSLFALGLLGRNRDPRGTGDAIAYRALRADAQLALPGGLVALIRYDRVLSDDDPSLDAERLAAHATWLAVGNLALRFEAQLDMLDFDRSTLYALFDLAL